METPTPHELTLAALAWTRPDEATHRFVPTPTVRGPWRIAIARAPAQAAPAR